MELNLEKAIADGNMTNKEAIKWLKDLGNRCIISDEYAAEQIEKLTEKEYLSKHPYKIFQGSDEKWHTYLPGSDGKRIAKKNKDKKALEKVVIEYWMNQEEINTFGKTCREWMDYKLKYGEVQKQTYDRYQTDYHRFFDYTEIDEMPIESITAGVLEDFIRDTIVSKQLTSKAFSGMRLLIKGTFKYAFKRDMTKLNIQNFFDTIDLSHKMFRRKVVSDRDMVFTDAEVKKITQWIDEQEPTLLNYGILLAFYTGLRVGEIAALTPADIYGDILHVNKTEIRYRGADGKYVFEVRNDAKTEAGNREVILNPDAKELLKRIRYLNPFGEYLFMKNGERIKEKAFTVKLTKICGYLKIKEKSMHKARKTYATKLLNNGVDESVILSQMGHTQIATTKNHYYYNNNEFANAKMQIAGAVSY